MFFNRDRKQQEEQPKEQPQESVTQQPVPEVKEPIQIDDTVNYTKLTDIERDTHQCGVMIPNQMQCPQRAYIYLSDTNMYLCAFHTANMFSVAPQEHKQYHQVKKD